jgi:hypothetical protein
VIFRWLACAIIFAGSLVAEGSDTSVSDRDASIQWRPLLRQSLFFLGIQHGFRLATEPGTREGLKGPFLHGWYDSLSNLHGWADGDPFLVNYVGHPLQGSVTGYIWVHNDPKFRATEIGKSAQYWKSRLRATAFSWAYSTQFEIGPLSEASLGKIQNSYPQQGFVDHVATPATGALWMIAEDAIDRFLIRRIEDRVPAPWVRALARSGLNPARTFANALRLKQPWYRDTRAGVRAFGGSHSVQAQSRSETVQPNASSPRFQFTAASSYSRLWADHRQSLNCIGGYAGADFRMNDAISIVGEVNGCKLFYSSDETSGDAMTFLLGPRWTHRKPARWIPFAEALAGAQRVTLDRHDPNLVGYLLKASRGLRLTNEQHSLVSTTVQSNGFALAAGGGLEVLLTPALSFRAVDVRYTKAWVPRGEQASYEASIRLSVGLTLRVGTW